MVNTPMFVDDMMYTPYDQRSVDDVDDYKPPHNVRTAYSYLHIRVRTRSAGGACIRHLDTGVYTTLQSGRLRQPTELAYNF